jgi:flagellar basal body P-ring protein FlgI
MSRRTGFLGVVLLALAGCLGPQARLQMADDAEFKKDMSVKTVGDIADVRGVGPVQVSGIALVTGLDGTGGTPQGGYRTELANLLRKQKVEHVDEILNSPNNAMVLVTAFIPAGARRGDKIDVEVTLPPGSKAISLAGGYLQTCGLRNHDSVKNVSPEYKGPDGAIAGHIMAWARGPVMLGMGEGATATEMRRGRVWRGGVSQIELPYYLLLKKEGKSVRVANAVAERLNYLFQDDTQRLQRLSVQARQLAVLDDVAQHLNHKFDTGPDAGKVAKAQSNESVQLRVPYNYRLNPERYVYVAHLVPLDVEPEPLARYRKRLQKLLGDPAETVMAARRLEALGRDSVPLLRQGLTHEHPLVRYASAEALAFLGDATGVDQLAKLAALHPLLSGNCLTALSSLDEPSCRKRLAELLAEDGEELRTGAFAALRGLAEHDLPEPGLKTPWGDPLRECLHKQLNGELLGGSFWLHRVAAKSQRLVCFSADTRAEIVLFGDRIALSAPIRTLAGQEYALTFEPGGDRCAVSRIAAKLGKRQTLCAPVLEDIIRTMAELGADYPDVVDLIRKLDERGCLNCKARLYAAPPEVTPQMLVEWGRDHRDSAELEQKLINAAPAH